MSNKNRPKPIRTKADLDKFLGLGPLEAKLGAIARGDAVIKNGKVVHVKRDS